MRFLCNHCDQKIHANHYWKGMSVTCPGCGKFTELRYREGQEIPDTEYGISFSDFKQLFAAGATFTLLAWGFAFAYLVCQTWSPGSFTGITDPSQPRTFLERLFLSFTNLSATGLSDILPVTAPARVLVMLEQFSGIGYIAVVVSRLIGMTIVHYEAESKS